MKKLLMTAAVAAVALGLGSTASLAEAYKACWIYVGPVGDGGWSFQHDEGRKAVALAYGASLKFGDILCTSATDGMHCTNATTKAGFDISRAAYSLR